MKTLTTKDKEYLEELVYDIHDPDTDAPGNNKVERLLKHFDYLLAVYARLAEREAFYEGRDDTLWIVRVDGLLCSLHEGPTDLD